MLACLTQWFSSTNHTAHTDRPELPSTILGVARGRCYTAAQSLSHIRKPPGFQWKPGKDGGPSGRFVVTWPTIGAYRLGVPQCSGRTHRSRLKSRGSTRVSQPGKTALRKSETSYRAGRSLKAITKEIGIGSERLSRLLREPRVGLRR